jgi:uncharacterized protein YndB with AHSA1/START domain
MATISVSAEGRVAAPPERVYRILADYRRHHPRILPPAFTDFAVERGGVGEGTIIRFRVTVGGRGQDFRQRVTEPVPGRVLREADLDADRATTFTVVPEGSASRVRIETAWRAGGLRGLIERVVAPRLLGPLYRDELARLDHYAREAQG